VAHACGFARRSQGTPVARTVPNRATSTGEKECL
jgi:hypothetical protein